MTELRSALVTDCGSTTSKALLFQKTPDGWIVAARGEAPTTVEAPVADVTVGLTNAFLETQEVSGRRLLMDDSAPEQRPLLKADDVGAQGIDAYFSTSSAGGGLQMVVTGVASLVSGKSAQRAALGAGAIVLEVMCADDGREDFDRVERLRRLKPDIILITGGTDGGAVEPLLDIVEAVHAAAPAPRFGDTLKLPVIYAGNDAVFDEVERLLGGFASIEKVKNVRRFVDDEDLTEAREAIHELFLSHVMSHSPGYGKLLQWVDAPVLPTPTAVGEILFPYAELHRLNILCADIGGATTDVFSTFHTADGVMQRNRTVSANLGMSYSIGNVLLEAGEANIARWLDASISHGEIRERIRNKMIRPTSIPQAKEDLALEQAVCREALRLSLVHHESLVGSSIGGRRRRGISEVFSQNEERGGFSRMALNLVIGSGGVLSHAPSRSDAARMMLDGFELEGVTELAVDSIFMLPHLGALAQREAAGAFELLEKACLVRIGHSIVPKYSSRIRAGNLATVEFNGVSVGTVCVGEVREVSWEASVCGTLTVRPSSSRVDVGAGFGRSLTKTIRTGEVGFLFDGRNRPFATRGNS